MDRAHRASLHRVVTSCGCRVVEVTGGDPPEWRGFAMAQRHPDGSVVLAIYAKEAREDGYPAASGGAAFALLLAAEQAAADVSAVLGEWHPSSDNFQTFKGLRADGVEPRAAALRTFTGTEARRHGYGAAVRVEEADDVVRVRFERGGP